MSVGTSRPDAAGAAAWGNVMVGSLRQAQQALGEPPTGDAAGAPGVARRLREMGAGVVCIVGELGPDGRSIDWLDSEHARGWLASAPGTVRQSGNSHSFAGHLAAAIARGFVAADAAVLAKMATTRRSDAGEDPHAGIGQGAHYVHDSALLPRLSWGEDEPCFGDTPPAAPRRLDLYAIVDSAERVTQVLAAGIRTVQLRIKAPPSPDAGWHAMLRREIQRGIAACRAAGAELFVNDHWQLAGELEAHGVHLGQEDLLALGDGGRAALRATGLALGVSSHSLWELCRARTLSPRYIACGPVWPTLTKAMPWRPQGLDNLGWWVRIAQVPVVAIGGVLGPERVTAAARCGADGVGIVRGLGQDPAKVVPALQAALEAGRQQQAVATGERPWPHPSLASTQAAGTRID